MGGVPKEEKPLREELRNLRCRRVSVRRLKNLKNTTNAGQELDELHEASGFVRDRGKYARTTGPSRMKALEGLVAVVRQINENPATSAHLLQPSRRTR